MTHFAARAGRLGTLVVPAGVSVCALVLVACTAGAPPAPASTPSASPPFVIPTPSLSVVETGDLSNVGPVPWQFATRVDDRTLDVRYLGAQNRCQVLANVRVAESAGEVAITVFLGTPPEHVGDVCTNLGVPARTRVPLSSPLGDRRVLDGSTRPPEERTVRSP